MVEGEIRYNDNISRDFLNRDINTPVIVIPIGFVIGWLFYPPAINQLSYNHSYMDIHIQTL